MSTEVTSTEYGVIIHHDEWNTLELKWLPTTKDSTEAAARDTMALFATETEKLKPRFLIVDTTEFLHRWADDMMAWRDKEIIPHYNAGGVAKVSRSRLSNPVPNRRLKALPPSPPGGSPAGTAHTNGWPADRVPGFPAFITTSAVLRDPIREPEMPVACVDIPAGNQHPLAPHRLREG